MVTEVMLQLEKLPISEGVEWDGKNGKIANLTINHNSDDRSNISGKMSVDTRIFGNKNDILYGDKTAAGQTKFLHQKYIERQNTIKFYEGIIKWVESGRKGDPEVFLKNLGIPIENVPKKSKTTVESWYNNPSIDDATIIDSCNKYIARCKAELIPIEPTHDRVYNSPTEKTERYITGLVPNTNVKFISLFTMKDFNFSDAIKHGHLRSNGNTKEMGIKPTNNAIPVKYDNNVTPNIAQNFSLDGVRDGHFKQEYQYQGGKYNTSELGADDLARELRKTKQYTSVNQFIDKSIMYAAYVLKKEGYHPSYIVAAPSSSNFNHYYCINLSRKLGVEYVPDFFERSVLNIKFRKGDEELMRQKGITKDDIKDFKNDISKLAISEICYNISQPMEIFLNKYKHYFSNIRFEKGRRDKISFDDVKHYIFGYLSDILKTFIGGTNYVEGYVTAQFKIQKRRYQEKRFDTKYLLSEFSKIISKEDLLNDFRIAIHEMVKIIKGNADALTKGNFRLNPKRVKITKFDQRFREFIHNMYVVADKNLTNGVLHKRFSNAKFLIFDEDINSGATLKLTIEALEEKLPVSNENNILCLVNAYSASGS